MRLALRRIKAAPAALFGLVSAFYGLMRSAAASAVAGCRALVSALVSAVQVVMDLSSAALPLCAKPLHEYTSGCFLIAFALARAGVSWSCCMAIFFGLAHMDAQRTRRRRKAERPASPPPYLDAEAAEEAAWLNRVLQDLWPFYQADFSRYLHGKLEPLIAEAVAGLRLTRLSLGRGALHGPPPLRLDGMRVASAERRGDRFVHTLHVARLRLDLRGEDACAGLALQTLVGLGDRRLLCRPCPCARVGTTGTSG